MKTVLNYNPFRQNEILRITSWVILFAFMNLTTGCAYHYKVKDRPKISETYHQLLEGENYIVLHENDKAFHFLIYGISDEEKIITGNLQPLPENRTIYRVTDPKRVNKYQSKSKFKMPRNEIHLYVKDVEIQKNKNIVLHFDQIFKVEEYRGANGPKVAGGIILGIITIAIISAMVDYSKNGLGIPVW